MLCASMFLVTDCSDTRTDFAIGQKAADGQDANARRENSLPVTGEYRARTELRPSKFGGSLPLLAPDVLINTLPAKSHSACGSLSAAFPGDSQDSDCHHSPGPGLTDLLGSR